MKPKNFPGRKQQRRKNALERILSEIEYRKSKWNYSEWGRSERIEWLQEQSNYLEKIIFKNGNSGPRTWH